MNHRIIHHVVFVAALLLLAILFYRSFASIVDIWQRSETFAHGFVIAPLALYLIWTKRKELERTEFAVNFLPLLFIFPVGVLWMLGRLADVLVVEQFTAVTMFPLILWASYGWRVFSLLSFPLAFLFFAVPAGEGLIPYLIKFTAHFTVAAIKLTGIPVFFEGNLISLPTGDWSVVTACSGVRYLMASVTLGAFYAYITYTSNIRRTLFIFVAIAFPIVANGLRAFMIVMIGHFSDMKLATGVDHIVYGWLFFGVVMFIMFWLGGIWRQREAEFPSQVGHQKVSVHDNKKPAMAMLALLALLVAIWPLWLRYAESDTVHYTSDVRLPDEIADWRKLEDMVTEWTPNYLNSTKLLRQAYTNGEAVIGIYIAYYDKQRQDAELINAQNTLFKGEKSGWIKLSETNVELKEDIYPKHIKQYQIKSSRQQLFVWHWYWMNNRTFINQYMVKLQEAVLKLFGKSSSGAAVFIYQEIDDILVPQADPQAFFRVLSTSLVELLNAHASKESVR